MRATPARLISIRLIVEVAAVFAVCEVAIMLVLGALAPNLSGVGEAFVDGALLTVLSTPLMLWRFAAAQRRIGNNPHADVELARRPLLLALAAFVVVCAITLYTAWQVAKSRALATEQKFTRQSEALTHDLEQRFQRPYQGIGASAALVKTLPDLTRSAFSAYWHAHDIDQDYPGVRGFGFIERIERRDINQFIARQRADAAPDFTLRSSGEAADLFVIKWIEPLAPNASARGYDIGSEPVRRVAVEDAVSTGKPTRTGIITLVQDGQKRPGYLFVVPVFSEPASPTGKATPRLLGLAYAPVVVEELLRTKQPLPREQLEFTLHDGDAKSDATLLFSSAAGLPTGPLHSLERRIMVGGHAITVSVFSSPEFDAAAAAQRPLQLVIGGILIAALLAWSLWLLAVGRQHALALATRMTQELKSTGERLQRAHDHFEQVIELSPTSLLMVDPQGRIEMINAWTERLFGYSRDFLLGKQVEILIPDSARERHTKLRKELGERPVDQAMRLGRELVGRRQDGSEFPAEVSLRKIAMDNGPHMLVSVIDLTTRKAIEAELVNHRDHLQDMVAERTASAERARDAAERANQAKSLFLRNISHELRTPLHAVLSFAQIGQQKTSAGTGSTPTIAPEVMNRYFSRIRDGGTRLRDLLDDLLTLTDLQSAELGMNLQPNALGDVLINAVAHWTAARNTSPTIDIRPFNSADAVMCDAPRIEACIAHILDNAARYAADSVITIEVDACARAAGSEAQIRCAISDHGPGIPELEREVVFEAFAEGSHTRNDAGGKGLGLSICRGIVNAHGGSIHAEETPGGGCRIVFTLPRPTSISVIK